MAQLSFNDACMILEIDPSKAANQACVKTAYKKMALRTHPDKNRDDPNAGEKFQEVAAAFQRLFVGPSGMGGNNDSGGARNPSTQPPNVNKLFRKRGTGGPEFNPRSYSSSSIYGDSFRHSYKPNDRFPHRYKDPTCDSDGGGVVDGDGYGGGSINNDSLGYTGRGGDIGANAGVDRTCNPDFAFQMFSEVFGTTGVIRFSDGVSRFSADGTTIDSSFTAKGRAHTGINANTSTVTGENSEQTGP